MSLGVGNQAAYSPANTLSAECSLSRRSEIDRQADVSAADETGLDFTLPRTGPQYPRLLSSGGMSGGSPEHSPGSPGRPRSTSGSCERRFAAATTGTSPRGPGAWDAGPRRWLG